MKSRICRIKRSIRAISPVISVLLMIAIAVVASLVVYAWVMGYIGFQTGHVGKAVQIQSVARDSATGNLVVYVQNVGQGTVGLDPAGSLYANDTLQPSSIDSPKLDPGQTATITATNYPIALGDIVKVKVASADGTFSQVTQSPAGNADISPNPVTFTVTVSGGSGGSITPAGPTVTVNQGANQGFTIAANTGYHIVDVQVDSVSQGAVGTYTFNNVQVDHAIAASFAVDTVTHTITASAGANGQISPVGAVTVNDGASQTFTITANSGYHVSDVLVDSVSVGAVTSYPFTSVVADHAIAASFAVDAPVLDHFAFNTISSPQVAGTAFSITITAKDASGNTVTSYTGTNTLTVSTGTISPTSSTAFAAGVWTGQVTLYTTGTTITIGTTGATKTGTSNSINVNAGSGTFGYNQQGSSSYNINDMILGTIFTCPSSGTGRSITAYMTTSSSTNRNVKAAIYSPTGTRIATTEEKSINQNNDGWVTFNFISGSEPQLTAGTQYALVLWASNDMNFYRTTTSNYQVRYQDLNYGSWPNPANFNSATNEYSIYCTYSIP